MDRFAAATQGGCEHVDCTDEEANSIIRLAYLAGVCGVKQDPEWSRQQLCRAINKRAPPPFDVKPWLGKHKVPFTPILIHTRSPRFNDVNVRRKNVIVKRATQWLMINVFPAVCTQESKETRLAFEEKLARYMDDYITVYGSRIPSDHMEAVSLALFYVLGSAIGLSESCEHEGFNQEFRTYEWSWDTGPIVLNRYGELVRSWTELCHGRCNPAIWKAYVNHMLTNKRVPFEKYALFW